MDSTDHAALSIGPGAGENVIRIIRKYFGKDQAGVPTQGGVSGRIIGVLLQIGFCLRRNSNFAVCNLNRTLMAIPKLDVIGGGAGIGIGARKKERESGRVLGCEVQVQRAAECEELA